MRKMTKKNKIAALAAAVALTGVGGGVAFAYWSAAGAGNGSGANSAGTTDVTLHANFAGGLAPGAANSKTVTYTADNPNTSSTTVHITTASVGIDAAHVGAGCDADWFHVTIPAGTVAVAASSSGTEIGTGTLSMDDLAVSQDGCKGATVTVSATSN